MTAYAIFLTRLEPLTRKIAGLWNEHPEACEDWVRDELLRLATEELPFIRHPDRWQAFITISVCNRAKTRITQIAAQSDPMILETVTAIDAMAVPEPDINAETILSSISLRDRAILKLSYGIDPNTTEWHALAIASSRDIHALKTHFIDSLDRINENASSDDTTLTGLLMTILKHQRTIRQLQTNLDILGLLNPPDDTAITQTIEKLHTETRALHTTYSRYQKLQKPRRRRIQASILAPAVGLRINDIHQIISRARRKIKENYQ
ncbi:hypothetical protein JXA80_02755 [bacterium]|nr:hypothetical protein [candidate division CSSED10-310 bacterium]